MVAAKKSQGELMQLEDAQPLPRIDESDRYLEWQQTIMSAARVASRAHALRGEGRRRACEIALAYAEYFGVAYTTPEDFDERYQGVWESREEFATQLLDDIGELGGDSLTARYFNYAAFTHDLFIGDYEAITLSSTYDLVIVRR